LEEFDNIKLIERSPIRISSFYHDTTYSLSTYDHRSPINSVQQNLPPFLLTSLSAATQKKYDSTAWYSMWIKNSTDLWFWQSSLLFSRHSSLPRCCHFNTRGNLPGM